MKCLALLGSPKKEGNTATLLASFIEGAASKGHSVKSVWLQEKKILFCNACDFCKKTGMCVHQDDMTTELYSDIITSDIIVHAFPVYWWSIPAQTKVFQDRIYAMDYSLLKGKKFYLLSTYTDRDPNSGFGIVESSFKEICDYLKMDFAGRLGVCSGTGPVRDNREALERAFSMGAGI
ncbi:MAG: flavodoxin family protein [Aminobacteriaceae bacterium]